MEAVALDRTGILLQLKQLNEEFSAQRKTYTEKRNELIKALGDDDVFFFHSRPEHDPLKKGKRMTICGIVSNGKLIIGVAKLNYKDTFKRDVGREEALKKAKETPTMEVDLQLGKVKKQFRKIVQKLLKELRSPDELKNFSDKTLRKLSKLKLVSNI